VKSAGTQIRALTALALLLASISVAAGSLSLSQWKIEAEQGARITVRAGVLDVDVPGGATLWFKRELHAPVTIEYEVMAVDEGGTNDRVSDVNAFWMATNRDGSSPLGQRGGPFEQYDNLLTYYVGIGGNSNSTTRMRRYIGEPDERPLLPAHDLHDPKTLLRANRWQKVTLIAGGQGAEVRRDGELLFRLHDAQPYTRGWFAIRTVKSHLRVRNLRISNQE
jgi:uncharacterized protein DUF6250